MVTYLHPGAEWLLEEIVEFQVGRPCRVVFEGAMSRKDRIIGLASNTAISLCALWSDGRLMGDEYVLRTFLHEVGHYARRGDFPGYVTPDMEEVIHLGHVKLAVRRGMGQDDAERRADEKITRGRAAFRASEDDADAFRDRALKAMKDAGLGRGSSIPDRLEYLRTHAV